MKDYSKILFLIVLVFSLYQIFVFHSSTSLDKHLKDFSTNYRIFSLELPDEMDFAGEAVPLHINDVWERLDREMLVNIYWQSNTILVIKRAARWFPLIEKILKENGIPDDFKYIAMIESAFQNVTSPSGAQGFWQFLDETGKKYGLEINEHVDERYHVEKATLAACNYFKEAYGYFNNWTLVAASYNMGIGGVNVQLKKQKVNSFYDLFLNIETSRYIFRLLAAKEIYENQENYGFYILKKHLYKPLKTYEIITDTTIASLVDFAILHGSTYRNLKLLNPWLRSTELPNKNRKIYSISFPEQSVEDEVNEEENNEMAADTLAVPEPSQIQIVIHTVGKKEKLSDIASKYNVELEDLKKWNNLSDEKLKTGQEIQIMIIR